MNAVAEFKRRVPGSKGRRKSRRKMFWRWGDDGAPNNWRLWFTGRHLAKIGQRIAKAIGL